MARGRPGEVVLGALRRPGVSLDHHVPDQLGALPEALPLEVGHGDRRRSQEEIGEMVGDDAVALLGHLRG